MAYVRKSQREKEFVIPPVALVLERFPGLAKTPHIKSVCGRPPTYQLEAEYEGIAGPIAFFCEKHAEQLSEQYGIPLEKGPIIEDLEEAKKKLKL